MKRKILMVLIIVASSFSFYACGPSQAKLDAQATQVVEDHYATQTAAPTATPTITLTPTPTPTATPTATIEPTVDILLEEMNIWWAEYLKNIAEYAKGLTEFVNFLQQDDKFKSMSPTELQDYLNLTMGSMIDNITILSNSNCPDVELQETYESLYGETLAMSYNFNTAFETGDLDAYEDAFQNLLNAVTQYSVVADKVKERFSD